MSRAIRASDLYSFACPGDPQISPDGGMVAFVVQTLDQSEDRTKTDIWIAAVTGAGAGPGEPHRLTNSGGKDRHPRWAPDGHTLAFVSERSGKPQIWVINANGGEAWHLPTEERVGSAPVWSPDGRFIAFTSKVFDKAADWQPYPGAPAKDRLRAEQAALARLRDAGKAGADGTRERRPEASDVKVITRMRHRMDGIGYYGDLRSHIYVVPVQRPEPGAAPAPARKVTFGDYDHDQPSWSPDGKTIVCVATRRDDGDYLNKQDIWAIDLVAGGMTQLVDGSGPVTGPSFSPDGKFLLWGGHDGRHAGSTTSQAFVADLTGRPHPIPQFDTTSLTAALDRPIGNPVSSDVRYAPAAVPPVWGPGGGGSTASAGPAGRSVYTLIGDHGSAYAVEIVLPERVGCGPLTEPPVIRPAAGAPGQVLAALSVASNGALAYQAGTAAEPDEVYVKTWATAPVATTSTTGPAGTAGIAGPAGGAGHSTGTSQRRLTRFNDKLLSELALGRPEKFSFEGADGWNIDGWLLKPPAPVSASTSAGSTPAATALASVTAPAAAPAAGKPGPLVLFIHGGPHGCYGDSFMFQAQILASNGMTVLYTNPRGSQTYGQDFAKAVVGDWGGKDYQDIMAGVDWAIASGLADPARLGVTGWSYGGYMTSWVITQTRRFAAAVAGAIVFNRHNFYGTSDIGFSFGEHQFGGTPWDEPERLLERSAVKYVKNVTTPLLLVHGEGDLRCPIEQADQFFTALKRQRKEVVLTRYPGEFHGFTRPSHREDRYERLLAWFRHYLEA